MPRSLAAAPLPPPRPSALPPSTPSGWTPAARWRRTLPVALLLAGCVGGDPGEDELPLTEASAALTTTAVPSGYNNYCSVVNGAAWAFSTGADPCGAMLASSGWSSSTIQRAGLYNQFGTNTVIMRCSVGGALGTWIGYGDGPLTAAFNEANAHYQRRGCTFTVAPKALPIFQAPFSVAPLPVGFAWSNRAYDFAVMPGNPGSEPPQVTLNVNPYAQNAWVPNTCATPYAGCAHIVSYRGEDRSTAPESNHDAFDWSMTSGAPLRAMAPGVVVAKRSRATPGCFTSTQNELYIKYVVGTSEFSRYAETFYAYYAHLSFAAGVNVGSTVTAGQLIGAVSNSGCTGGAAHLHLAIMRGSNTARDYRPALDTTPATFGAGGGNPDNSVAHIDPYGWQASQAIPNVDPGGYVWYDTTIPDMGPGGTDRLGGGALSINLWKSGQAPPRPCDRNTSAWLVATSGGFFTTMVNGAAHCEH